MSLPTFRPARTRPFVGIAASVIVGASAAAQSTRPRPESKSAPADDSHAREVSPVFKGVLLDIPLIANDIETFPTRPDAPWKPRFDEYFTLALDDKDDFERALANLANRRLAPAIKIDGGEIANFGDAIRFVFGGAGAGADAQKNVGERLEQLMGALRKAAQLPAAPQTQAPGGAPTLSAVDFESRLLPLIQTWCGKYNAPGQTIHFYPSAEAGASTKNAWDPNNHFGSFNWTVAQGVGLALLDAAPAGATPTIDPAAGAPELLAFRTLKQSDRLMDQLLHWKIDHPFTGVRVNSAPVAHSMAVHGVEHPVVSYSIHYSVGKYTWVTDLREYHELRDGVNRIVTEYYSLDPDRVLFWWLAGRDTYIPIHDSRGRFVALLFFTAFGFDITGVGQDPAQQIRDNQGNITWTARGWQRDHATAPDGVRKRLFGGK
jgi:hypothetical protein